VQFLSPKFHSRYAGARTLQRALFHHAVFMWLYMFVYAVCPSIMFIILCCWICACRSYVLGMFRAQRLC